MNPLWILLVAAGGGLLALGLGLWLWLRRRRKLRREIRRLAPTLRHPVVLAHGIMGFDKVGLGPVKNAYFRGVEPRLVRLGAKVYAFRVRPAATVAARAEELARAVQSLDEGKVNVIAHSMGGLDARYVASRLGLAAKFASITTVGTPHRGTPLADLGTGVWGAGPAAALLEKAGVDLKGFFDLTTQRMARFNQDVPDAKGVHYASFTARAPGALTAINPLLLPTWKLIQAKHGDNDGLVPLSSQVWGEVLGTVDADHWAQIGWSLSFDAPAFYEILVKELIKRGF